MMIDKTIHIVYGDLDLTDTPVSVADLADDLTVTGNLYARGTEITHFPATITIYGSIDLSISPLATFSATHVGGTLDVSYTKIATLPDNLHVCGDLLIEGCLDFSSFPRGLRVDGDLWIGGVDVPLSEDITVRGDIHTENYMD